MEGPMRGAFLIAGALLAACTPKEPVTDISSAMPTKHQDHISIVVDGDPLVHPNRILDAQQYYSLVVDQTFTNGDGTFVMNADGTVTGSGVTSKKEPFTFVANYNFSDGFYCRSKGIMNGDRPIPDDCQVVIIEGDALALVRKRGTGDIAHYWFVR